MAEFSLARDFPSAEEADWQALVQEALKGAPFASLRSTTYDGIVIEPLYARAVGASVIPGRAPGAPWGIMQRIDLPDPEAANAQILDDLHNAASGFVLVFADAVGDYGYTLSATEAAIAQALNGVHLDAGVTLELDFGPPSRQVAGVVASYVKAKGLAPSSLQIRFGFDPLGAMATRGVVPMPWTELAAMVTGLISGLANQGFTGPFAVADGRPVHAAGGSEAQELAFVLANAIAYLRALEAGGIKLDDARRYIFFRLAADQDQFLTIAKFRAIRKLWTRIEEACGFKPSRAIVTAETAWRMMTRRDAYGNIVRGTIAAFAAAIGGADAITVLPFSAALGLPDAFARRIARNTQTILIEEANLQRVADPAAGSGAIESLTDQLCMRAWALFQEIERTGGTAKALETGSIQQAVAKVRAEREANIARRKDFSHRHQRLPRSYRGTGCRARSAKERHGRRRAGPAHRAAPTFQARRAFRALAGSKRRLSLPLWRTPQSISCLPRTPLRFQRAGELRQEPVRVGRYRGNQLRRRLGAISPRRGEVDAAGVG